MMELAASVVDETSGAYQVGSWAGRLVLGLLIVLLVRKYVFGKPAPVLGRGNRSTRDAATPPDRSGGGTPRPATQTILPAPRSARPRRS